MYLADLVERGRCRRPPQLDPRQCLSETSKILSDSYSLEDVVRDTLGHLSIRKLLVGDKWRTRRCLIARCRESVRTEEHPSGRSRKPMGTYGKLSAASFDSALRTWSASRRAMTCWI
jgi:hypothetical protein